jgi:hypothetical protein
MGYSRNSSDMGDQGGTFTELPGWNQGAGLITRQSTRRGAVNEMESHLPRLLGRKVDKLEHFDIVGLVCLRGSQGWSGRHLYVECPVQICVRIRWIRSYTQ